MIRSAAGKSTGTKPMPGYNTTKRFTISVVLNVSQSLSETLKAISSRRNTNPIDIVDTTSWYLAPFVNRRKAGDSECISCGSFLGEQGKKICRAE